MSNSTSYFNFILLYKVYFTRNIKQVWYILRQFQWNCFLWFKTEITKVLFLCCINAKTFWDFAIEEQKQPFEEIKTRCQSPIVATQTNPQPNDELELNSQTMSEMWRQKQFLPVCFFPSQKICNRCNKPQLFRSSYVCFVCAIFFNLVSFLFSPWLWHRFQWVWTSYFPVSIPSLHR